MIQSEIIVFIVLGRNHWSSCRVSKWILCPSWGVLVVLQWELRMMGWMVIGTLSSWGSSGVPVVLQMEASSVLLQPSLDLGGLHSCHIKSQRMWLGKLSNHTSLNWTQAHVLMLLSSACVAISHAQHHLYHAQQCHQWFWWLLHSKWGADPSSVGRCPGSRWVQTVSIQICNILMVYWMSWGVKTCSLGQCIGMMKFHPTLWIWYCQPACEWFPPESGCGSDPSWSMGWDPLGLSRATVIQLA